MKTSTVCRAAIGLAWALSHVANASGLSPAEEALALEAQETVPWLPEKRIAKQHELGIQTLSVELVDTKNSTGRLARVYQFSHNTERARSVTVDLISGKPLYQTDITSIHLPLNSAEIEFATQRLRLDTVLIEHMRAEQRRRGVTPFSSLEQLTLKAVIYTSPNQDHPCQRERCALLSFADDSHTVFSLEPVVQLRTGKITPLTSR